MLGTTDAWQFRSEQVDRLGSLLNDTRLPLKSRFRALFNLRNIGCNLSVKWISKCLQDNSTLLKHELAYCLGQMQNKSAVPILIDLLKDHRQEPIVRHEAGEALGAIGDEAAKNVLQEYAKDSCPEIAETCELALQRLTWIKENDDKTESPYRSIDPTCTASEDDVNVLRCILTDDSKSLWDRYRAMFKLRNIKTDASVKALSQGLYCEDSALLRHEVAYVLGQVQSPIAIDALKSRLSLSSENSMVRHECAEALGAIATTECITILQNYIDDVEASNCVIATTCYQIVRESCEVALDMAEYENSGELNYAVVKE
ncbi:PBS lyase HEAT-like repeat protein [Dictyocaulus viviparus]|uniref:Deoxyhypusine hydroxylase n=1 Tax=Dictyocaulus viviparus TaxID=29172 RepID=A0A0D8Y2P2_DICVI|nr:PBS lyase HEAT-like repeat protein [Dictyocaulus viviparus]